MDNKSFTHNSDYNGHKVKYSPLPHSDFSTDSHKMENGDSMTPVDTQTLARVSDMEYKPTRTRTMSVDQVAQVGNGSVATLPTLHIPGETGELAGLSSELKREDSETLIDQASSLQIAPEKLKKILDQIKAKKIKYKMVFSISVITLLMKAYASILFPWFLPYYHTIMFPVLVIIRLAVYTKMSWQLFCLDFCYFGNLAFLLFCWAYPQSEVFFAVVFGAVAGPMAVAVLVFRNSIVFHDYDRMTSAYIHLMPNLCVYVIRWFPSQSAQNWYFYPNSTFSDIPMYTNKTEMITDYLPHWVDAGWLWIAIVPLVWFIVHTALYMLIENLIFDDKKYLTSYKWLSSNQKSAIYHILTLGGRITNQTKVKVSWMLFNVLYGLVSVIAAYVSYQYQIAHTIYLAVLYAWAIYNGASFYIDVFAKRGLGASND